MNLYLHRDTLLAGVTLGRMYVNGVYECEVLEDVHRGSAPKVPGATCIPNGRYRVSITHSPRFKRLLPLVHDVPGFVGIRIHAGNTADDTEGCLLPGRRRGVLNGKDAVLESTAAFNALYAKLLLAKGEVWLTVSTQPPKVIHL